MAKASIRCICELCGKEFKHEKICNNRREADSYEEWAERNITICPECWKEEQKRKKEEEARKAANGIDLVELIGTEKQVAWAEKIRNETIKKIKDFCESHGCSEEIQHTLIDGVNTKPEARFWIDNRDKLCYRFDIIKFFAPQLFEE